MRQLLGKILPDNDLARKCLAIGLTVLLAGLRITTASSQHFIGNCGATRSSIRSTSGF